MTNGNDWSRYAGVDYLSSFIRHYGRSKLDGAPKGSGRYPLGSGKKGRDKQIDKFVDKNGNLTTFGRKSLDTMMSTDKKMSGYLLDSNYEQLEKYGVKHVDDTTDMLSSGSKLGRFADTDAIDARPKYVYLKGSIDEDIYKDFFFEPRHEYETTKDLKVAPARVMADALCKNFGAMKVKDVLATYTTIPVDLDNGSLETGLYKRLIKSKVSELYNLVNVTSGRTTDYHRRATESDYKMLDTYINTAKNQTTTIINAVMMKVPNGRDMVLNEIKSQGYDAVVDVEDKLQHFRYPLIILNPEESLRKLR